MLKFLKIMFFSLFCLFHLGTYGQTTIETKETADKFFEKGQFIEATPLYMTLLTSNQRDFDVNFKYGACLLYSANKRLDAFKYLNYAITSETVDPRAFYYLGKAQHLNYQFSEAIINYKKYKTKATTNLDKNLDVDRQILMCENGKRLMTTITDLVVQEKKEMTLDKFYQLYNLQNIGGDFLVTSDFQSKIDKKKEHTPLIHFPKSKSVFYYSSYGDDDKSGKDIYIRRRLPTGEWGLPQKLAGGVNTEFDEDYPFFHTGDNYLYFSSKGHNSMGGYDVFRSKYDPETNSFGPAENMDFAISTPADDMLYIVDSLNQNAYFSSNRQSQLGKVFVYKVLVEKVPLQLSVVKGTFYNSINPDNKKIFIEVRDYANGDIVGNFNSNEKGIYLIPFPKGGKYEYSIRVEGKPDIYKTIVSIPFLKEFKPLKQKITDEIIGENEVVKVIDLFNEQVEDISDVMAIVVKKRAELAPNADQFVLHKEIALDTKILNELGIGNYKLNEVSDLLDKEVNEAQEAAKKSEDLNNKINYQTLEILEKVNLLDLAIKDKVAQADKTENPDAKYLLMKSAESLTVKQELLREKAREDMKYADSLAKLPNASNVKKANDLIEIQKQYQILINENKEQEALTLLSANKELLKNVIQSKSNDELQILIDQSLTLQEEIDALKKKDNSYLENITALNKANIALEQSKTTAKSKEIANIDAKIRANNSEIELIRSEKKIIENKLETKGNTYIQTSEKIDKLQSISTIKDSKIISKEEANKALNSLETTNSNTLKAYVALQLSELEKLKPELKKEELVENKEVINIDKNYASKLNEIESNLNLNEKDKNTLKNQLNSDLIKNIDVKLNEINQKLSADPTDQKLLNAKTNLQTLKNKVQENIDNTTDLINTSNTTTNTTTATNSNNGSNGTLNTASNTTATGTNTTTNTTASTNSNNSSNGTLNTASNTTATGTNTTTNTTASTNSNNGSNGTLNTASNSDAISQEEVLTFINSISPTYKSNISSIENENNLSDIEKNQRIIDENQNLIQKLNQLKTENNVELSKSPTNKEFIQKDEIIDRAITDISLELNRKKEALKNLASTSSNNQFSESKLIEEIEPNYNRKIEEISKDVSLSESQKLKSIQKEDENLIANIDLSISKLDKELETNSDKITISKKENLIQLKSTIEEQIKQREIQIKEKVTAENFSIISKMDEDEKKGLIEKLRIENLGSNSDEVNKEYATSEELKKQQNLFETYEAKIKKEILLVNSQIENNENLELQKKKFILDEELKLIEDKKEVIKTNLKAIESNTTEITSNNTMNSSNFVVTEKEIQKVISSLNPNYEVAIKTIESNSNLTPTQKAEKEFSEESKMLNALTTLKASNQQQISNSPNNQELKNKALTIEKAIAEVKNLYIEDSKTIVSNQKASFDVLTNEIQPTYSDNKTSIISNSSLNEIEKLEELQKIDAQLTSKIDSKLTEINAQLKEKETPELEAKRQQLEILKTATEENVANREKSLETKKQLATNLTSKKSDKSNNSLNESEVKEVIHSINPNYEATIAAIETNSNLTETEKLEKIVLEEQKMLNALQKRETSNKQQLAVSPNDLELKNKAEVLEKALTAIDSKLQNNSAELRSVDSKKYKQLADNVLPNYSSTIETIQSNNSLTAASKTNAIQLENKKLVAAIDLQLNEINKQLKSNPTAELEVKKSELEVLKVTTNNAVANGNQSKEVVSNTSSSTLALQNVTNENASLSDSDVKEIVKSIDPNFDAKIKNIQSNVTLNANEKLEKIIAEENKMLNSLTELSIQTTTNFTADPSNSELKNKAQAVDNAVVAVQNEMKVDAVQITKQNKTKFEAISNEVSPDYSQNIQTAQSSLNLSEVEKLKAIQQEDKKLLNALSNSILSIEKQLQNSSYPALIARKNDLEILKLATALNIEKRESLIISNTAVASNSANQNVLDQKADLTDPAVKTVINSINPNFENNIQEIASNSNLTSSEKIEKIVVEEENMLKALNHLNQLTTSELAKNPNDTALKEKSVSIEKAISIIATDKSEKDKVITVAKAPITTTEIISTISPTYTENVASIESNSTLSEVAKLKAIQQEDTKLIREIDTKINQLEKQIQTNPTSELVNQKEKLESIKSEKEEASLERAQLISSKENVVQNKETETAVLDMISEVKPNYSEKVKSINESSDNPSKKIENLIKEEKDLISKLESVKSKDESVVKKDPANEEKKQEITTIEKAIQQSESKVNTLTNDLVQTEVNAIDPVQLITKVDEKYTDEITAIERLNSSTKQADLIARETELQQKIAEKIASNSKQIEKSGSISLKAENTVLAQQLDASKNRVEALKEADIVNPINSENVSENKVASLEIRQSILGSNSVEVEKTYTTLDELKKQDVILANYEQTLVNQLDEVTKELEKNSQNSNLIEQKISLEEEIKLVQNKRKAGRITIGELERVAVVKSDEQIQIENLQTENDLLKQKAQNPDLTSKQKALITKGISQNEKQQNELTTIVVTNTLTKEQEENKQKTTQIIPLSNSSNSIVAVAQTQNTRLTSEVEILVNKAKDTKDAEEKNYILTQALDKQVQANEIIENALIDNAIQVASNNEIASLYTKEELEQKKRRYTIQIGELTSEIQSLDAQINATKPNKASSLIQKRDELITQQEQLKVEVSRIEKQLSGEKVTTVSTINKKAIEEAITYKEENEIAQTDVYKSYVQSVSKALVTEKKITVLNNELEEQRVVAKQLIKTSIDNPSEANKDAVKEQLHLIKSGETAKEVLENQLKIEQTEANGILLQNEGVSMKMQNMAQRGVLPVDKQELIAKLVPLPASGLEIKTDVKRSDVFIPIPVDVKEPNGLVYRVQVGAFSKPIPQDLFSSFNPVSGEKIANTSITRYMAGYFNGAGKAVEALTL
ncbi:MAG: hypothetical protein HYR91_09120, partial [Flavobacteriia bacterium]|nr:hypothetical protein [Flavobacteriia bacterium]